MALFNANSLLSFICFSKYQSTGAAKGTVYSFPNSFPDSVMVDQSLDISVD
jgi:hypothetical protein